MVFLIRAIRCDYIAESAPLKPEYSLVEANLSGDNKATAHSSINVRGKKVSAEVTLPRELVEKRLHTTPVRLEQYWKMSVVGALQSGSVGVQGPFANALAALSIACRQNPACVAESAVGVTRMEIIQNGDRYVTVTLPSIMVRTVGGGTSLPTLAGEISLTAAICANEFARAHEKVARGRKSGCPDNA